MSEALVQRTLPELEQSIERGLSTFIEVGEALLEIREQRLYREAHGTFEDYCRERWEFTGARARQLMDASEIATTVAVVNEAQARELAPLKDDPDELAEVWTEASKDGRPTAEKVREAVQRRVDPAKPAPEYTLCPTCGHRLRRDKPRPVGGAA